MFWAVLRVIAATAAILALSLTTTSPGEYVPTSQVVGSFIVVFGLFYFLTTSVGDLVELALERRMSRRG